MPDDESHQNPGSPEAVAAGCTCPIVDNGRGRGYMGQPGVFNIFEDCPIHGKLLKEADR